MNTSADWGGVAERVKAFEARADAENMSPIRRDLEMRKAIWKSYPSLDFMLAYGRDYSIGPNSFAGPRGEEKMCFMNAAHLADDDQSLTYVEGTMLIHGIPIDHAWCSDANGVVVDPTIRNGNDGRIGGYFGVPFRRDYLRKATELNKVYGLLGYRAEKTARKLFELGLEAGQQWLLERKRK